MPQARRRFLVLIVCISSFKFQDFMIAFPYGNGVLLFVLWAAARKSYAV
jgi:hypothetical protein